MTTAPTVMDGQATDDLACFRDGYRAWLAANVPGLSAAADLADTAAAARQWMRTLHQAGYAAPTWPKEHGGMGATLAQQIAMLEEDEAAGAPSLAVLSIALHHAGATLIAHGSDEQRRHLRAILHGEEIWCQGFSEPDAGSDLASLQTRAVRRGDEYVVSGQKVWSSYAALADWCLLLARTDPDAPKRKGISYFLLDLRAPGVEVRPLRQMTGSAEFCEIFLDEVAVPAANLVGPENDGWRVSQTTLATERGPFFLASVRALCRRLDQAVEALRRTPHECGGAATSDPVVRQRLARDAGDIEILAELYGHVLDAQPHDGHAGSQASIIKLCYTSVLARLTGDVIDAFGIEGQIGHPLAEDQLSRGDWMAEHLQSWGLAIGGGTNEIQRNLIAERVLGLPRETLG